MIVPEGISFFFTTTVYIPTFLCTIFFFFLYRVDQKGSLFPHNVKYKDVTVFFWLNVAENYAMFSLFNYYPSKLYQRKNACLFDIEWVAYYLKFIFVWNFPFG